MKMNLFKWMFLILIFGIFISCNETQNNEDNQNSEEFNDVEVTDNNVEETDARNDVLAV